MWRSRSVKDTLVILGLEHNTVAMVLHLSTSKLELQEKPPVTDKLTVPCLLCGVGRENVPAQDL